MEIDKENNKYNFSDLDDYEVEKGKLSGFDFDALDFEDSNLNLKKQESSRTEKKGGKTTKKRRVITKVDYEKLVGPDGLIKLKEQGPKLKFMDKKKSKNATIDNLRTIVNFYQTWAHGLCPQMKFKDVIFQSENVCKEKRLKNYLDDLREEAKNKQNDLSGKTLADEESEFWHTPSQSASRTKRFPSFEDKLSQNQDDFEDELEINSPIKVREKIIIGRDLEQIIQNSDSPIKNNILRPRRLVYDDEPDDSTLLNQTGSYPLGSYKDQDELDDEDDILGDLNILIPVIRKDQNGMFEDSTSLGNNKQASNMDIDQVYEDPTLTSLSPEMSSGSSFHLDICGDKDEIADKENSQPYTTDLPMSKRSTLFFDLGDKYVDLTPIYEEVNSGNGKDYFGEHDS